MAIKCFYWHPTNNFGDMLSPVVLGWISGQKIQLVPRDCPGKFLAVGSIMRTLCPGDTVWGAGSMYEEPIIPPKGVRFLAVRGPLTRDCIRGEVPEVYGDPSLFMPEIYTPTKSSKRYEVGVVLNEVDRPFFRSNTAIKSININLPWQVVIDLIASCDLILSSSLHGIIVAEAYGIPAVWIKVTDKVRGNGFKFRDYFASTDRPLFNPVFWRGDVSPCQKAILPKPKISLEPLRRSFQL